MNYALSLVDLHSLGAVLLREFRAALINRYFQVFAALSILGGLAALFFSEDANAIAFFLVQIALYLVSLFALLAGASSAQAERDEWQLMFSQPVPRSVFALGKFVAYFSIFAVVLLLLFLPGLTSGQWRQLIPLYWQTLLLAAVFLALGLTSGFIAHDRAQSLIIAVSAWLLLLFVLDLVSLFAARFELMQKMPDLWLSLLMANPLDAFRINALFSLEQIPAEAANKTPLASWWIAHAGVWFTFITTFWCAALLALTNFFLNRFEDA